MNNPNPSDDIFGGPAVVDDTPGQQQQQQQQEPQQQQQQSQADQQQQSDQSTQQTTQAVDPVQAALADLAKQVGTVTQHLAKPKTEPEKTKTPEELAKEWNIYNPLATRPDFFRKFFRAGDDVDDKTLAELEDLFYDMQKGLVGQAIVGARNLFQQELAKLQEQIAPLMEHTQRAQIEGLRNRFNETYPALKDEKYAPILNAVGQSLAGRQFASEAEYFKALAEGAAASIKTLLPDFDLGAQPTQHKQTNTPSLPRHAVGNQGGAGGGSTPTKGRNDDRSDEIF